MNLPRAMLLIILPILASGYFFFEKSEQQVLQIADVKEKPIQDPPVVTDYIGVKKALPAGTLKQNIGL